MRAKRYSSKKTSTRACWASPKARFLRVFRVCALRERRMPEDGFLCLWHVWDAPPGGWKLASSLETTPAWFKLALGEECRIFLARVLLNLWLNPERNVCFSICGLAQNETELQRCYACCRLTSKPRRCSERKRRQPHFAPRFLLLSGIREGLLLVGLCQWLQTICSGERVCRALHGTNEGRFGDPIANTHLLCS